MQIREDGSLSFGTERTEILMKEKLRKWPHKYVKCEVETRESPAKRRFFEGPVTAYWFYQNPRSKWKTLVEARENLKLRWNAKETFDTEGNSIFLPQSTKISNKRFGEMLLKMQQDWDEEGYEWPDPDAYEEWLHTNPAPGLEFPPVARLKEKYMQNFL